MIWTKSNALKKKENNPTSLKLHKFFSLAYNMASRRRAKQGFKLDWGTLQDRLSTDSSSVDSHLSWNTNKFYRTDLQIVSYAWDVHVSEQPGAKTHNSHRRV